MGERCADEKERRPVAAARGDAGVGSDLDLVMRTIAREVRWIWAWTYSTYV